ncbi:hypothetical protein Pmar_PMAR015918 [Perkinsus marinus ATCC 50983]|uniref:Mei2-like C-terminal RNA recognition motif domain-containing protein n=1 Tax=Perkinsus marinus (strain ATCC 50983 / TXsc) TaxID=423536 RepID=C5L433_PERM5|nr:hypothetical protein Pmar_PMAR015918 [Perkinsus marinus ATCC 50983]EER08499.1 hypothetical protein Pmar_PMAR015918 [Perkinsus marinus ATCC 50983]|eukprot:XP_002776683.1 hypothetical protein Pmar_PMAR015918 [Perkinsus marinus ATCC 50983]
MTASAPTGLGALTWHGGDRFGIALATSTCTRTSLSGYLSKRNDYQRPIRACTSDSELRIVWPTKAGDGVDHYKEVSEPKAILDQHVYNVGIDSTPGSIKINRGVTVRILNTKNGQSNPLPETLRTLTDYSLSSLLELWSNKIPCKQRTMGVRQMIVTRKARHPVPEATSSSYSTEGTSTVEEDSGLLPDTLSDLLRGFRGRYNFYYVPLTFRTRTSIGYAFVDFGTPSDALEFYDQFNGVQISDDKHMVVVSAHAQGLDAQIRLLRNSPVNTNTCSAFKPRLFELGSGKELDFPPAQFVPKKGHSHRSRHRQRRASSSAARERQFFGYSSFPNVH